MKKLIECCKGLMKKYCENKELIVINAILIVMLLVSCFANVFILRQNRHTIDEGSKIKQNYYSGIASELDSEGKLTYFYVVDGAKSDSFTGLAANHMTNELLFFSEGVWNSRTNRVEEFMGEEYYIKNGKADTSFTGNILVGNTAYSIQNGRVNAYENGIVKINNSYYKLVNGIQDKGFFDFATIEELGEEYYFELGKCDFNSRCIIGNESDYSIIIGNKLTQKPYNGMARDRDYYCYAFKNGEIDKDYNGYYWDEHWEKGYLLKNGLTARDVTCFIEQEDGNMLYIIKGINSNSYTGIAKVDGIKYYVAKNICNLGFSGEVTVNGRLYKVRDGIIEREIVDAQ